MAKKVVEGLKLETGANCTPSANWHIMAPGVLKGRDDNIPLSMETLSKHILFTGGIGCGKTTAMFHIVDQLIDRMSGQEVMVIFDSKGDFLKEFKKKFSRNPDRYAVISNDSSCTAIWNMFNEALIDGFDMVEENLMELATSIFSDSIEKDKTNPFFPSAAKNILYAIMMYLYKTNENKLKISYSKTGRYDGYVADIHNNMINQMTKSSIGDLVKTFQRKECRAYTEQMIEYLCNIDPFGDAETTNQGSSVMATLRNVSIDIFKGSFSKAGSFSIRDFIRKKGGRVLFIEYDVAQGRALGPIYKTLIDLAIKESLGRNRSPGNVYFIMDEFRLIPKLNLMDSGVNLGRSLGAKFIVGLQNVGQVDEIYGESESRSIISGFTTTFNFRTTDKETRELIKGAFGQCRCSFDVQSLSGGKQTEVVDVVTDGDILKLGIGQCIAAIPTVNPNPVLFQFKNY